MKVNPHIHLRPHGLANGRETIGVLLHPCQRVYNVDRPSDAGLKRGEALFDAGFGAGDVIAECLAVQPTVDPDLVARGATQQLIDRLTQPFAGNVPQRLLDPRQCTAQDRAAAVKLAAIDGLPMMLDPPRVFTD